MMDLLTSALLAVTNALLIPDVLLLFALSGLALLQAGGVLGEALTRARSAPAFRDFVERHKRARDTGTRGFALEVVPAAFGLPARALDAALAGPAASAAREKTLDDLELRARRLLGRLQLGVRLGPVLGLAGTLIPLGPALLGLSRGDVAALSDKLIVAFATTVLGLFVGGLCFWLHAVRKRWYEQDLSDIAFVLERAEPS